MVNIFSPFSYAVLLVKLDQLAAGIIITPFPITSFTFSFILQGEVYIV